jgi:mono/diheme cytochrome c family protein
MQMRTTAIVTAAMIMLGASASTGRADEDPAAVFKEQCAKCHGETGHADTPAGKTLKAPALAGDAKVAGTSLPELVKAVQENPKHKAMVSKLSEAQISAGATRAKALAEGK